MKKLTTIVLALIVMTLGTLVGCQSSSPSSPLQSSSSPVLPSSVAFFPVAQDKYAGQAYPAALAKGTLVLENGYLRLGSFPETGETSLVVWPPGFSVREESGVVQVLFPDGTLAASVGDSLDLGGGDVPLEIVEQYIGKSVPATCPGPFWLTGNVAYSSENIANIEGLLSNRGKLELEDTIVKFCNLPLPQYLPSGYVIQRAMVSDWQVYPLKVPSGNEMHVRVASLIYSDVAISANIDPKTLQIASYVANNKVGLFDIAGRNAIQLNIIAWSGSFLWKDYMKFLNVPLTQEKGLFDGTSGYLDTLLPNTSDASWLTSWVLPNINQQQYILTMLSSQTFPESELAKIAQATKD